MTKPRYMKSAGFTLVEMAIVLVIIGIILAGVMKGRDIVRGAQVKQFSQQFAQKWGTIAQTYYDKTGNVLNDGAINGGSAAQPDGAMDSTMPLRIAAIVQRLNDVGITPCTLIKSKINQQGVRCVAAWTPAASCATGNVGVNLTQTIVEGEYTGSMNVQMDLAQMIFDNYTEPGQTSYRNCVVFYGMPTDVAIGLDTAIDGTVDGQKGSFVNMYNLTPANIDALPYASTVRGPGGSDTVDLNAAGTIWQSANLRGAQICAIVLDY